MTMAMLSSQGTQTPATIPGTMSDAETSACIMHQSVFADHLTHSGSNEEMISAAFQLGETATGSPGSGAMLYAVKVRHCPSPFSLTLTVKTKTEQCSVTIHIKTASILVQTRIIPAPTPVSP